MKEVYNFLDSLNITKSDTLIIGVSFGPDSMFLLDLLKNKYKDNKIVCAHVHHNHRKESDIEAIKLEDYCKCNNIIFEFMKIDSYTDNKFTEEEARNKRYNFFKSLIDKYNSKYLFTAHHGDDLSETILMRLVRGSNLKGYSGISLVSMRDNYNIVRPLLFLTKEYIESYCDKNNIPYAVDISNESDKYTRNRYRNNILKFLKSENKNVHTKFLDFSLELKKYDNYINSIALKEYKNVIDNNNINLDKLNKLDSLIKEKVIELYLYNNYKNDIKNVNKSHLSKIIDLSNNSSNKRINLPCKKVLVKSYNKIYFDNGSNYNNYSYVLDDKVLLPNNYTIECINALDDTSNFVTAFNSKEISLPLYVRNKKDGDKIEILGLGGNKKIKDIFIDEKVDISRRKNYPVVTDSNDNILWLPGLKKSKYDKSKNGKYDIILKYSLKGEKDE